MAAVRGSKQYQMKVVPHRPVYKAFVFFEDELAQEVSQVRPCEVEVAPPSPPTQAPQVVGNRGV